MKVKYLLLLACAFCTAKSLNAQQVAAPEVVLQSNYGGALQEAVDAILPTADGGNVLVGYTDSKGNGRADMWMVKTDEQGKVVWERTYGGEKNDQGYDFTATNDGGYLLVGATQSKGAGNRDIWVVKTDARGELQWDKTFGDKYADGANAVVKTKGGGYLIAGSHHESFRVKKDDVIKYEMTHYIVLLQIDEQGEQVWEQKIKCEDIVSVTDIVQTQDGGFAVLTNTRFNKSKHEDIWLIKTDNTGTQVWDKVFKGKTVDVGSALVQTKEGNLVVGGFTYPEGITNANAWLICVNSKGRKQWDNTFGGDNTDQAYTLTIDNDGGFVLGGINSSGEREDGSLWLVKADTNGKLVWETTFGKEYFEQITDVYVTPAGEYVVAGYAPMRIVPKDESKQLNDSNSNKIYGDIRLVKLK